MEIMSSIMNLGYWWLLSCCHFISTCLSTHLFGFCLSCGVPGYKEGERCVLVVRMRFIQPLAQLHGKNERLQFPLPHGYHDITEVPSSKILLPRVTSTLADCCCEERIRSRHHSFGGKAAHTVITNGHLIKIDLRLLIGYKWQSSFRQSCCGSDSDVAVRLWCRLSRSERQRTFDLETALICGCRTATLDRDYHVYHYMAPSCVHISSTFSFLFTAKGHFRFPKRNWSFFPFILQVSQES